jgi:hypothetical protein
MITFTSFAGERRSSVLRRAIASGMTGLPVRDFTYAGRVLLAFNAPKYARAG